MEMNICSRISKLTRWSSVCPWRLCKTQSLCKEGNIIKDAANWKVEIFLPHSHYSNGRDYMRKLCLKTWRHRTLEDWPICVQCHVLWIHRQKFYKVLGIYYGSLFSYWMSWKSQARHKMEQDGIHESLLKIGSKNQEIGFSRWFPVASCCTPPPRAYSSIGMQCLSSLHLHQECSKYVLTCLAVFSPSIESHSYEYQCWYIKSDSLGS